MRKHWLHNLIWIIPVILIRAPIILLGFAAEWYVEFVDRIDDHLPTLKR